jgi:hypothetical protein
MITNKHDISLPLAVWLLHDDYDYVKGVEKYISATTLMKPLRHIILPKRMDPGTVELDVEDFVARSMGHALHDSIEKAWTSGGYTRALKQLGYSEKVIERIRVNPSDVEWMLNPNMIPVYLEQRLMRTFNGWTIGGKFDLVTEGIIQDQKSTSAFTWTHGTKDDDYRLQMSIYRWLDDAQEVPKITEDFGRINFIFTDWQKFSAKSNPNYPQKRVESKDIPLLSLKETEDWVRWKLTQVELYGKTPEAELPHCTDEELWRSEPVFKFYTDPAKTAGRSTKNFDNLADARSFQADKGGKGIIKTIPGEPKRCGYCEVFSVCTQRKQYFDE